MAQAEKKVPGLNNHDNAVIRNTDVLSRLADDSKGSLSDFECELRSWISSGVCQGKSGAFHAWRDAFTGTLSYEYPEISGYVLTYLANDGDVISVGQRTAEWLVSRLTSGDASARGQDGKAVYNFDLAMIATGLMSWGSRMGIDRYVREGLNLVKFIQTQILSEGCLLPLSRAHPSSPRSSTWSTDGRSHLLKVVQCLLIGKSLGLSEADEVATILMESTQSLQLDTGRFITHPADTETNLHALLYAAEGLWIWGTSQNDVIAIKRARMAVQWVWSHQLNTGGFPNVVDHIHGNSIGVEQSDVMCQAIRLAFFLDIQPPGLYRAITRMIQASHADERGRAILYRPLSGDLHLNVWATIFGVQAARMVTTKGSLLSWEQLV